MEAQRRCFLLSLVWVEGLRVKSGLNSAPTLALPGQVVERAKRHQIREGIVPLLAPPDLVAHLQVFERSASDIATRPAPAPALFSSAFSVSRMPPWSISGPGPASSREYRSKKPSVEGCEPLRSRTLPTASRQRGTETNQRRRVSPETSLL